MSENRLKNYKLEEKSFLEEIAKHKVSKTFKQRKKEGSFVGKFRNKNTKKSKDLFEGLDKEKFKDSSQTLFEKEILELVPEEYRKR